ncbi:MAG: hypothetical protein A2076_12420 [Geobacteraceae bacterium GWC2_53_11]|nr:MAG: hypothetical protein A2076_12420 [Geobacteraceae bacterium GWC2_53_11]
MKENGTSAHHQWKFFRAGGFDQVLLETGDDLLALSQLDNKLWSALSCPVNGVEFDQRTLELIDSDGDGHIRVPEILAAAEWAGACLNDRQQLVNGSQGVLLSAISCETEEGSRILDAARTLLANLGKPEAEVITVSDTCNSETILAQTRFNGDGIITAASTDDELLAGWVTDIIECMGSETDRSGADGITREMIERFAADSAALLAWHDEEPGGADITAPDEAMLLWHTVKPKMDDYFLRCAMAVYDSRATTIFNSSDENLAALAPRNLSEIGDEIATLPLSAVTVTGSLDLIQGINPAWSKAIARLRRDIIRPLLGDLAVLTEERWRELKSAVEQYETWWSNRIDTPVSTLDVERLKQWQDEQTEAKLLALIDQDLALKPAFDAIVEVERLTRYCRDLLALANNFVSFRDFYTGRGKAIFQSGSLFLDGRSFELCITVTDVAKHALLANLSRVYLVYCDCTRSGGSDKMTVAAAITNGDSDQLLVGRNGIFYDRQGRDWDATIVRIIEHPISIRQAFWDPYKRIGKMVGESLQKVAAARSRMNEEKAVAELIPAGTKKPDAKPAPPPFDVGKFAGIFAAVGLAIGAIGTAIASILTGFFKLPWWQMPLVLVGIMLFVSGPSIFLAWLKLRQRNLGRLLDANGWAVNTRAKINIPFGASLTGMARLPQGAITSLFDPFAEKKRPWKRWLILAIAIVAALAAWRMGLLPF